MFHLTRPAIPGRAPKNINVPTECVKVSLIGGEYHAECRTRAACEILCRLHGYSHAPAPAAPKKKAKPPAPKPAAAKPQATPAPAAKKRAKKKS